MKLFRLAAACILLVFSFAMLSFCAFEPEIAPFETLRVFVSGENCTTLKFTPAVSGKYCFESVCDYDTVGFVFDEKMNILASDETSGEGANFKIVCFFESGKTYYLGAKHALGMTLDFEVRLTEFDHEHEFKAVSKTEPTCKSKGKIVFECRCKAQKNETIDELPHAFALVETTATCTKGGTGVFECRSCGFLKTQKQEPLGHEQEESFKTEKEATCTASGKKSLFCARCGKKLESQTTEKLGHDFSGKFKTEKQATCTASGKKSKICLRCGAKGEQTTVAPKGHCFEKSFTLDKKATVFQSGSLSKHCRRCRAVSEKRTVSKISTVKLLENEFIFSGKSKKPTLVVKDSKQNVLKSGRDYKAEFEKNAKQIGTHFVKINFCGNYGGQKTLTFKIIPQTVSYIQTKESENGVSLSWNDCGGASEYKIYKFIKATGEYIALGKTKKTAFKAENLKSGTDYIFAVRTFKTVGEKTFLSKKALSVKTATVPVKTQIKAVRQDGGAALSWKSVSCSGYIIYMSQGNGEPFRQVKNVVGSSQTNYKKTNLSQSKTHYFKIQPYKKANGKTLFGKMSKAAKLQ